MSGAATIREAVGGAEVINFAGGGRDINLALSAKERNDLGNADRLIARFGDDFLFVRDVGLHVWGETHWRREGADDTVRQWAHETARAILEEVDAMQRAGCPAEMAQAEWTERLEKLFKWTVASGNRNRIEGMIREATPYRSVGPDAMDADPMVINLANGTLRLAGACDELTAHRRDDLLSKMAPVEFVPEATCPRFGAFLDRVQPDPAIQGFLQRWAGYCLTGDTSEQVLVFNYGTGANGKSVFTDLIARLMGPYAMTLPFSSLLRDDRKRGSEATPDLARLPGSRLVRASEPEKGSKFAEATIKAITGGEEITVRHLRHDFFDFVPHFKINLSGNHKPSIRGQDIGIWRRLLLVPWMVTIPREERDKKLTERLWAEERSGILNWVLDGTRLWLEKGLEVPDAVRAATDQYREDSDPIGRFIGECVEEAAGFTVQASEMYEAYRKWCVANAERPWTNTSFGKVLPERGLERSDGRIRVYQNVRLVNVPDIGADEPPPVEGPEDYGA